MTRPFLVCVFAAVLLSACDGPEQPGAVPSFATEATATPAVSATPTEWVSPATTAAVEPASSSKAPAAGGPRIVRFEIEVKPSCPSSGPEFSNPGNPVTLGWKVTGVDTVEILINGGLYYSYPAVHAAEIPFTCEGDEGATERHEYTLRATDAGGRVVEDTVPATARINIGS